MLIHHYNNTSMSKTDFLFYSIRKYIRVDGAPKNTGTKNWKAGCRSNQNIVG